MSRYSPAHVKPQGPGDARPTATQIVKDEGLEGKLKGKVIIVTGTSSGIGVETARALSGTGATLYVTARNLTQAKIALNGILEPGRVDLVEMDNASFESVRAAASFILKKANNKVNILINNAGVMAIAGLQFTKDGHEMQFGTNHLSHFLLFQLLKPSLLGSSTADFHSRVINLGSSAHHIQSINESNNYNFQKGDYNPWSAYGQSKTANLYMTNEIDRRYGSQGLHATTVHPGLIITPINKHVDPSIAAGFLNEAVLKSAKTVEQGAATTVWAAIGKAWEDKGGKYLADCAEAERGEDNHNIGGGTGYASHSYDPEKEARLWKDSLRMVGMEDDQ